MKKILYIIIPAVLLVVGFNFIQSKKQSNLPGTCVLNAQEYIEADKSDAVTLDVRTPHEYESGHLEGAEIMDVNRESFKSEIEKLDKSRTYYVYCKSGIRSRNAANYMRKNGFEKVCELEGGINALSSVGIKIVK